MKKVKNALFGRRSKRAINPDTSTTVFSSNRGLATILTHPTDDQELSHSSSSLTHPSESPAGTSTPVVTLPQRQISGQPTSLVSWDAILSAKDGSEADKVKTEGSIEGILFYVEIYH
jgi:hypothetical protein